ncbi:BCD family MFS transporter [Rhizobium sp. AAP43]|uniref:BCD family MFS transporter n=1 Tax=Rhizobium sp. AAP43 TaxID=1523420 RepID=UPI000A431C61|nr:BCD family MFS transporter [Rhizobium sp. AAP43]
MHPSSLPQKMKDETGRGTDQRRNHELSQGLGWISIFRLGLVQAALGAIVVLTTSTLNRVMIVELGLAAVIPGALVGLHYGVQITRPIWGHKSDAGQDRTTWILRGMALLAVSATLAAATTLLFERSFTLGLAVAVLAYSLIGIGIGACGTSLLALIAARTTPQRKAAAATITWILMIFGIIVSSVLVGSTLDPYSHPRLIAITAITGVLCFCITLVAVGRIEHRSRQPARKSASLETSSFQESFSDVWHDPDARLFTLFIFISMLAYATQDLILEPFAGLMFGMSPGETTSLTGTQHAGVLIGMLLVGIAGTILGKTMPGMPKLIIAGGCFVSALALAGLGLSSLHAPSWPLETNVFVLGVANGAFAVAAISTMMLLAGAGKRADHGMRMGIWGAAQAIAFGLGGLLGTVALDTGRSLSQDNGIAFCAVFGLEAALFLVATGMAVRLRRTGTSKISQDLHRSATVAAVPGE